MKNHDYMIYFICAFFLFSSNAFAWFWNSDSPEKLYSDIYKSFTVLLVSQNFAPKPGPELAKKRDLAKEELNSNIPKVASSDLPLLRNNLSLFTEAIIAANSESSNQMFSQKPINFRDSPEIASFSKLFSKTPGLSECWEVVLKLLENQNIMIEKAKLNDPSLSPMQIALFQATIDLIKKQDSKTFFDLLKMKNQEIKAMNEKVINDFLKRP
ncbi:MAG: hypothetical protein HQM08_28240 [Candidatus Riflebacteria bacterium]|nr:hypothetical protein [Candidatus Riflebacteria bacterium]